jgi:FkbM family methyltransferase
VGTHPIRSGEAAGLLLDPGGSRPGYVLGTNERATQEFIAAHLQPGGTFYDVGANVGFFTLLGARLVGPGGRVYAYEPLPRTAALLRANAGRNGFEHVEVVEAAVAAREGEAELALGSSDQDPHLAHGRGEATVTVAVVTLDGELARGRRPPTLVKIDAEGAESEVLAGMESVLTAHRPVVVCEIHQSLHLREHPVAARLRELGYRLSWLEEGVEKDEPYWAPHLAAVPE